MEQISEDLRKRWYDLGLKYLEAGIVESAVRCFEKAGYTKDIILASAENAKNKLKEAEAKFDNSEKQHTQKAITVLESLQEILEEKSKLQRSQK